jgi:hypothetical protein
MPLHKWATERAIGFLLSDEAAMISRGQPADRRRLHQQPAMLAENRWTNSLKTGPADYESLAGQLSCKVTAADGPVVTELAPPCGRCRLAGVLLARGDWLVAVQAD